MFQKIYHKDKDSEITSVNLGPFYLNDTQKHHLKKLSPVLDATQSIRLTAASVVSTVENSAIGGERNFLNESHLGLLPYDPPPSKKTKKYYPYDMLPRPLTEHKYEVNNILFDFNVGLFLMRFEIFLYAENFCFSQAREMIIKGRPDGVIKGDENSCNQTLDAILSFVYPEMKDIHLEKQVWFQNLQERKIPVTHNR